MLNRANFRDLIDGIDWDQVGDSHYHQDDEMLRELADLILFNVMPADQQYQYQQAAENDPNLKVLDFYKAGQHFGALDKGKDGVRDSFYYGLLSDPERAKADAWTADGDVDASHFYQIYHKQLDKENNPKRAKLVRMFQEIEKLL